MTAESLYTLFSVEVLEGAQGVKGIMIKYDLCCSCAHAIEKYFPVGMSSGKVSPPYLHTHER